MHVRWSLAAGRSTFSGLGGQFIPAEWHFLGSTCTQQPFPQVSNVHHVWGTAYRPPYMSPQFFPPAWTAMMIPMTGTVQIEWEVECFDSCTDEAWNIDGATPPFELTVDLPLEIGMHPALQRYVTVFNASELLIKPATSEILKKASNISEMMFNQMSATAICRVVPKQ